MFRTYEAMEIYDIIYLSSINKIETICLNSFIWAFPFLKKERGRAFHFNLPFRKSAEGKDFRCNP